MDKTKLNELLDSIYELEGLVHLALTRDNNPDRLPLLIKMKGEALARLSSALSPEESDGDAAPEETYVLEKEEPQDNFPIQESIPVAEMPIEEDIQSAVETVFSELPDELPAEKEPRGRLVFSINDRYRFKRELFNNSDVDFNNTLAIVASMENYDEAEDYFLGELQWDSKQGDVADFLGIIKKYFKE